jgi:DNA-directed RNA polymerase subunit M/transcription elongation factor TFIIS
MSKRKNDEFEDFDFTEESPKNQKTSSRNSTPQKKQKTSVSLKSPKTTSPKNATPKSSSPKSVTPKSRIPKSETPSKNGVALVYPKETTFKELIQKSLDQLTEKPWRQAKGVEFRQKCRTHLISAFMKNIPEGVENYNNNVEIIVWAIESAAYDSFFVFSTNIYAQQIRSLCRHIPKNPTRFLSLDPVYVATMSPQEMVGDFKNIQISKEPIKQKNIFGSKSETPCKKCHKRNVSYYEVQLRSGDENGEFTFISCLFYIFI